MQHLSSVSTEHTKLPRSYPHTRVIGYEPPRSYHHMFTTIHEPTRSWHNIFRSKYSIIVLKHHTPTINNSIIAWRSLSAARQNLPRPPGRTPQPPGAMSVQPSLLNVFRLAGHTLPPVTAQCKDSSRWSYCLMLTLVPLGAVLIVEFH